MGDKPRAANRAVWAAVPRAEGCTSYQLPAFRLDGKVLVLHGATAEHCAFYAGSGTAVEAFEVRACSEEREAS